MSICEYTCQTKYAQEKVVQALQIVYAMALEKAIKYRLDPFVSSIHKKYVQEIQQLIGVLEDENY